MINFKISLTVAVVSSLLLFIILGDSGFADHGSFEEIEKSGSRMYGERKIIVCGYSASEQSQILAVIGQAGLAEVPVVFADEGCLKKTLKEITALPDRFGATVNSRMQRAVILSGLSNKEVHRIMDVYRAGGLPSQVWAALIPTSENRMLKDMLNELSDEHNEVRQNQQKK